MGRSEFLDRIGVSLPHICGDRFQRPPQACGNSLQKLSDGFLFAVWQNSQNRHVTVRLLSGDDGNKVFPPFGQSDFINTDDV